MAIRWIMVVAMALLAGVAAAQDALALKDQKEKLSYALGMALGNQLRNQSVEVDPDLYVKGLKDALAGGKTLLTEEEARAAVNDLQRELRKKQMVLQAEKPLKNKQAGEAFLAKNKAKEGVVTLESGLQYKILKAGDGRKPTIDDTVVCHYRGTLIDGTEFDSSYKRNQPATFAVRKVIKGWSEALQLMPVGSQWQLFIPSHLAYGERGAGRTIGPNATLIFEVELMAIKDTSDARASEDSSKAEVAATQEGPSHSATPAAALTDIQVSFKLDPRLTKSLYMGERWVSPPTYSSVQEGKEFTVEAKAQGLDAKGTPTAISPEWIPADPEMVTVSPSQGNAVKITVKRAGESALKVASQGISKELVVKARYKGNAIQAEIAQQDK